MQVTPVDVAPGWAHGLGGAAGALKGYLQADAAIQQLQNDNKRLKLQQEEAERRNRLADMAEAELSMQYDQFQAKQEAEAGRIRGNQALNQATLLGEMANSQIDGERVQPGMDQTADLPPEWGQAFGTLQSLAQNGDIDPKDFANAAHTLGAAQGKVLRQKASDELFQQIQRDVAPGADGTSFWGRLAGQQEQGADGKPQPNEFDQFVDGIAERLQKGEDPILLAQEYQANRALADEEFNAKRTLALFADSFRQTVIAPNQQSAGPTVTAKLLSISDALERGDYGTGDGALRRAQIEANAASARMVPVRDRGKIVYVPEEDAKALTDQIKAGEKPRDPKLEMIEPFVKMVGEFKPNTDIGAPPIKQQHEQWLDTIEATAARFGYKLREDEKPAPTKPEAFDTAGMQSALNQAPPGKSPRPVQPGQAPPRNVPTWDTANENQRSSLVRMLERGSEADLQAIQSDPALQAFIDSMPEDEWRKIVPEKKPAPPANADGIWGGIKK